jgi:hypothetical protein
MTRGRLDLFKREPWRNNDCVAGLGDVTEEETSMADLNPQPLPPGERVRIFVSRDTAFDLKKMQKVTASVLGKLGCAGCHSGRILDFVHLNDFVVNPQTLEVSEVGPQGFGG